MILTKLKFKDKEHLNLRCLVQVGPEHAQHLYEEDWCSHSGLIVIQFLFLFELFRNHSDHMIISRQGSVLLEDK